MAIFWTIFAVLVTVMILVFFGLIASYRSQITMIVPELEAETIALRFTNTADCFTYQDPITGRIYPGVIDLNKYTQESLDSCYKTDAERGEYNFGLLIRGFQREEDLLITNNFFNNVDFTIYKDVLVRQGTENIPAKMEIFVERFG